MRALYIRTQYNRGIVLPLECLPFLDKMQIVDNDGYSEIKNLTTCKEFTTTCNFIDTADIDTAVAKAQEIADLEVRLEALRQ
jgi:hypothetical protein